MASFIGNRGWSVDGTWEDYHLGGQREQSEPRRRQGGVVTSDGYQPKYEPYDETHPDNWPPIVQGVSRGTEQELSAEVARLTAELAAAKTETERLRNRTHEIQEAADQRNKALAKQVAEYEGWIAFAQANWGMASLMEYGGVFALTKELAAANALLAKARAALQLSFRWADAAWDKWDADENHRVGKMLMALAGTLPRFAPDTDIIHATWKELNTAAEKASKTCK